MSPVGYIRDRWREPGRKRTGKRWQVKYRVDNRERDGGSYEVKAVAQRRLVELEAAVQRGQWVDPANTTTVLEATRSYVDGRPHGLGTRSRLESQIVNHVEGTELGRRRLTAVRPSEAQAWVTDRSRLLAPGTVRNLVALMRAVYSAAVADRLVSASPFERVVVPRDERGRVVPLTVAQVLALSQAIGPRYRAMVLVQAGIGVRIGELLALRARDVDFVAGTVRVQDQISRQTGLRVPPKTPRSRRTIPMPLMVARVLWEHLARVEPAEDGLLFHTASGRPYAHSTYGSVVFGRAVNRAGLPEDTVPHSLRHHYASVLLAAGESVVTVAERMGHDDAKLVLSTYGHLMPDSEGRTRQAVDSAWEGVDTATVHDHAAQPLPERS